eukprot:1203991-Rhodomonas_salina.1
MSCCCCCCCCCSAKRRRSSECTSSSLRLNGASPLSRSMGRTGFARLHDGGGEAVRCVGASGS